MKSPCVLLLLAAALGANDAAAQQPSATPITVFVEGAVVVDHDPTAESFYGPETGIAASVGLGVRLARHHSLRFEVDVPRWRTDDRASSGVIFCPPDAACMTVPRAQTSSHVAVRGVSYSFIYGRHFALADRFDLAVVGGAAAEQRDRQETISSDALDAAGNVVAHQTSTFNQQKNWPAALIGADAALRWFSHVSVVGRIRYHVFPYPTVNIVRPGVAVRWQF